MGNLRLTLAKATLCLALVVTLVARGAEFTMSQALHYPYSTELTAAEHGDVIAWVRKIEGVRNVWIAQGPTFTPVQLTQYTEDDGQEITQLTLSPDGGCLVFVRGGDHDANWSDEGNLAPDPASSPQQPEMAVWMVSLTGGPPQKIDDGDEPAISAKGALAYTKDHHVWSVPLGKCSPESGDKPSRLFFDRGKDGDLRWSPDGSRLAFVSDRGDHSFVTIFTSKDAPLVYLSPSTNRDSSPRWSSDSRQVAFVRRPGDGGAPVPILTQTPVRWSIRVALANGGASHMVWQSPHTLAGSFPDVDGGANLHWMAKNRLVFMAYLDDWPHLYSVEAAGGTPTLLTPGAFMVEHVTASRDGRFMIYDANTGSTAGDDDRRHVFRVSADHAGAAPLTSGETLEWTPVSAADNRIAFIAAGSREPPSIGIVDSDGSHRVDLALGALPADFPITRLLVPKRVTYRAADGTIVHGQLFESGESIPHEAKPAVIFVHGGPQRQMLLGWHYFEYYANAYAVNQYLATHGFVVLSVNYRLGIGYGRGFRDPEHASYAGAAEYQDVVAGAHFLQKLPGVDGKRIGIWGGSYGGYLTALSVARNSDLFKAGVDLHGVHDFSRLIPEIVKPAGRHEKGDYDKAAELAWDSSPVARIDGWKSPVLLIHGDDDRNVPFQQTVDLARRLEARNVPFEELVIPNETHDFLRYASWLRADEETARFFARHLGVAE